MLNVTQFPNDFSHCGWYEIAGEKPHFGGFQNRHDTDWLVIGAGFAGVSACRRLMENTNGQSITLIDAQKIAWSACGRNSGFMIDLPHELQSDDYSGAGRQQDLNQILLNRSAIDFARQMATDYNLGDSFKLCGKYHGATDGTGQKALNTFCRHLNQLDESFQALSASQMRELTGSQYFSSGIYTPNCAVLQPARYILDIVAGLQQHHLISIFENCPALQIEIDNSGYRIQTPQGVIAAGKIILTVNGHLESFGFYNNRTIPIYTFSSMTEELTSEQVKRLGGHDEWGLIPAHPMGTTVRKINYNNSSRIIIRNTFTYNANKETTAKQIEHLGRRHDKSFQQRFPMLNDVAMQYRWGGHLCLSLNSVPIFEQLQPNLYAACCHNGLGLSKGTLGGMLIADFATGQSNPLVNLLRAEPKPNRLPPKPLMTVGANAYLKWIHRQAGSDL